MVVGTAAERPVELALGFFDGEIVDAGVAVVHDAVFVELPVFVSVGAVPVAGVVVALVGEADGDAGSVEGPELFDEAIVELAAPFSGEEFDDLFAAVDELGAVSPFAVYRVGEGNLFGIAGVPSVFGFAYFLGGGFAGEWWDEILRRLWLCAQFLTPWYTLCAA